MKSTIYADPNEPVLQFAAQELKSHLTKMSRADYEITNDSAGADFTLSVANPGSKRNDEFSIKSSDRRVLLSGSNVRSVLFAVYRYLRELGFRWIRPGQDGEIRPQQGETVIDDLDINEKASYKYRTLCIEGACSFEHVRDLIDWGTKHFLSGYFIQFDYATCFWERWYKHEESPCMPGNPDFSIEDAKEILNRLIPEIEKRGLLFERMGHDWTCRTIGVTGEGWTSRKEDLSPDQQAMLAEVNGKRELWGDIALNTNLCYSSEAVQEKMVREIVDYTRNHPNLDLLHFWLADGVNNHCECSGCIDSRPADLYVQLLNKLDQALTRENLSTRIVFLIYVDLLWPPLQNKLENPDRFVLMFAPISRSYMESFDQVVIPDSKLPIYKKNKLEFPRNVGINLQFLQKWQEMFKGDCFDFDYHMLWTVNNDLCNINLARVLHRDIRYLSELGMHGFNSCQIQRLSFPHNLMLDVLATTLWNKTTEFDQTFQESMQQTFGEDAKSAGEFFVNVSKLWQPFYDPVYLPERDDQRIEEGLRNIPQIRQLIQGLSLLVGKDRTTEPHPIQQSWKYLGCYLDLLQLLLPAFDAYLKTEKVLCKSLFEKAFAWLWEHEPQLHAVLDVYELINVLRWRINELFEEKSGVV